MSISTDYSEQHTLQVEEGYHKAHISLLEKYAEALETCAKDANLKWRIDAVKDMIVHEKDNVLLARTRMAELKRGAKA
jgi:hypothetical protein